jgi:acyl-CoA reductase-like NAD-dependent aldehyde dehydrogenase
VSDWLRTRRPRLGELPDGLLIDGSWRAPVAGRYGESVDPSSGVQVGRYAVADAADVDRAVAAAAAAQPHRARRGLDGRAAGCARLHAVRTPHRDWLAELDCLDGGLPLDSARDDLDDALRQLRDWPGLARGLRGETFPLGDGLVHYTTHQPYGVVARIIPFNHPLYFAITGVLAALLAGNAVVLKTADQTPLAALAFAELTRGVLPAGVLNVLTGHAEAGRALVTHPGIRRIAFTGSTQVGLRIQQMAAADQVRTVSLELGGKNPMLVFPDVDVAAAADAAVRGMSFRVNQGQSCGSTSRVLVHRDILEAFVDALAERTGRLEVGPAYAEGTDVGPVVSAAQRDRIQALIDGGDAEGAAMVTGGRRRPDAGFFVAPTVFRDVHPEMEIARREIFGPVVGVQAWHDEDELVRVANDTPYGLTASVWTNDLAAALRMVDALQAGYVWVNDAATHYWGTPFGGWKDSGVGAEESLGELESYVQTKTVHLRPGTQADRGGDEQHEGT